LDAGVQVEAGAHMYSFILASILLLQIVGGDFLYTVQKGDSLTSIGARFGVDAHVLAEANELESDKLATGQILKVDNRHIVPPSNGGAIIVNVPQRMLFYYPAKGAPDGYPVAGGRPSWKTMTGNFQVVRMGRKSDLGCAVVDSK
jgi:L,D-transpeptidase ErfK/SrfK